MENFFIEDQFYSDMEDFVAIYFDNDEDMIRELPDDWTETVELAELQKIFQYQSTDLMEVLCDVNEERFPEDPDKTDTKILAAIEASMDFKKFNKMLPSLYYGSNKFAKITKEDLINHID